MSLALVGADMRVATGFLLPGMCWARWPVDRARRANSIEVRTCRGEYRRKNIPTRRRGLGLARFTLELDPCGAEVQTMMDPIFYNGMACIEPGHGAELRIPVVSRIRTDTDSLQVFLRIPVVIRIYAAVVSAFLAYPCTLRIESLTLRVSSCNVPSSCVTIIKH